MVVIVVTGGGATGISDLLAVPGASRTILEATVPYAREALGEWLIEADGRVTGNTAADMAITAARRAGELAPDLTDRIGLACTAALATDRDRRGADRAHLAAASVDGVIATMELALVRSHGRAVQEREVSDALIELLATVSGVASEPSANG